MPGYLNMSGRGYKRHAFSVRREIILPTPEPEPMEGGGYDDEYEEEPVVIRPTRSKRRRLPGQKLLKQLHRQRVKEREAARAAKNIEGVADELDGLEL